MLFFQYGVVDVFPDDLDIDNSAASSISFVILASFISISIHSMFVVAVVKFQICVVCDLFLWDRNSFSVVLVLYI